MPATAPPLDARLPYPYRAESAVVDAALARLTGLDWPAVIEAATPWVEGVRREPPPFWAMESLLREYPITTAEGLALMRLAEALLRVPDAETAIALTADQLGRAEFDEAAGGAHKMLAALAGSAIALSKKFLPEADVEGGLMQRLGARTVVGATVRAIQLLGRQFVLGRSIGEAMAEADAQRRDQPALRFSYDMLGEGARTEHDAVRHLAAYQNAIAAIAALRQRGGPEAADGISIKLSALFSRYEEAQRERVFETLVPRVWSLIEAAALADINFTIDAEECDRLELSLDILDVLAARVARSHPQWRGFGLALQTYQTRALELIDEVARIARRHGLRFMVRLVKGAYWDGEIKRAQEQGLAGYPVFTHKQHTDVAFLACAQALFDHADVIYTQFASHNAGTLAAIVQMARRSGNPAFELQRLHGMAEGIYREFLRSHPEVPLRIYAPVGEHRDLLAYLVRRLLENGANSSFVHQLADEAVPPAELLASPLSRIDAVSLPLPRALYGAERANSTGADLACGADRAPLEAALQGVVLETVAEATVADVDAAMARLHLGFARWNATPVAERAAILRLAADRLDAQLAPYCALLVREAGKTWGDCVAEVREAVDFLRYYAGQAEALAPQGRGVFVCISPWNFPLAIFAGQVAAALVAGNSVAAKPAEQTPGVAARFVALLHAAGVPHDALLLLHGAGEVVGARLVSDARCAGVAFTGSTPVARAIDRALARRDDPALPLIAETGGLNAMVVDSTALPEQVIDAVVQSAFRSAGQRCSALRLLAVHESIADGVIEMLAGAMAELRVGDPADLATDVGPLIDDEAKAHIARHVERLGREARLIAETPPGAAGPTHQRPIAFEIARIADLTEEIFGPVLHVVRWRGDPEATIEQINALGYGLTLGIQTRIDSRAERLAQAAHVGNVYVNRNIIGAVVGVQPFGGEGLSGTGPKAGGPHYLARFAREATPGGAAAEPLALEAHGQRPDLDTPLARAAAGRWPLTPLAARCDWLDRIGAIALAERARRALADQALPGPTGETNTLRLRPRGVVASVAATANAATQFQWQAALACGNTLLVALPAAARAQAEGVLAYWRDCGLPADAVLLLDAPFEAGALALAAHPRIAALLSDAGHARALRRVLAARPGAIVPLIGGPAHDALWRLAVEQTVTVNTAAAGGNAALLAGTTDRT
jgi:RHH-type proline utilization regulon transcriptional repressor/proline dehydrogenase/delta 1-pyrroline-5-carboxylate dehydrogenase